MEPVRDHRDFSASENRADSASETNLHLEWSQVLQRWFVVDSFQNAVL